MQRLYKFILLLFISLLILSLAYAFGTTWLQFKIMTHSFPGPQKPPMPHAFSILKIALPKALIYSLVLLLMLVLLLRKAMALQQKFTLNNILSTSGWFLLITMFICGIILLKYAGKAGYISYLLQMQEAFIFPFTEWLLYALSWFLLYFILASRINKFA